MAFGWLFILQIALYCIYGDVMIDLKLSLTWVTGCIYISKPLEFLQEKEIISLTTN
jgi:hypothetical protein